MLENQVFLVLNQAALYWLWSAPEQSYREPSKIRSITKSHEYVLDLLVHIWTHNSVQSWIFCRWLVSRNRAH